MSRAAIAAIAALVLGSSPAHAGDPTLEFFTIETEHFVIHYYSRLETSARRLAAVAERAHKYLAPALDHEPEQKRLRNRDIQFGQMAARKTISKTCCGNNTGEHYM